MAVSPLVALPTDVLQHSAPVSSPLKRPASAVPSSNGTPRPARHASHSVQVPANLDLAEQMNEQEKKKYVKG
jgi:cyclin-dependent kinase 7